MDISDMIYHNKFGYIYIINDSINHNNLFKIYPIVESDEDVNYVYSKKEKKFDCQNFNRILQIKNKSITLIHNSESSRRLIIYPKKGKGIRVELKLK